MIICPEGRVYTWGRGNMGQTGLGTTETASRPTRVEALVGHTVTQVNPYSAVTH